MSLDSADTTQDQLITTFGVITHNRPEALKRCLAGFLNNFEAYDRHPHIAVMDDSDQPELQKATAACVAELRATHPAFEFHYAGPAEKRRYMQALGHHVDVDPSVIAFALSDPENQGRTMGANRNALFLQTAGERFMSVDDDVICRPAVSREAHDGVIITDAHDPTHIRLFADRDALLQKQPADNIDVLGLHQTVLGETLGNFLRMHPHRPVTIRRRKNEVEIDFSESTSLIRVSWSGLYGDSGARYPTYYLWRDKHIRAQLTASEASYAGLSCSREIFRAAECLTFGSGAYCQSTALAYDNRTMLPPFMPVLRGEDVVFGRTYSSCFSDSLIAYSPWALLHSPITKRSNNASDIVLSARSTTFATAVSMLIKTFDIAEPGADNAASLQKLGEYLCILGQSPTSDFLNLLHTHFTKAMAQRITYLENQIAGNLPDVPRQWSDDIRGHIAILRKKFDLAVFSHSLLAEESSTNAGKRLALAQRLTFRYGQLLKIWPSLIAGARELKAKGVTVSTG